eukprot:scaffold113861_cov21-Tisochrysis_lutea.AAC.1
MCVCVCARTLVWGRGRGKGRKEGREKGGMFGWRMRSVRCSVAGCICWSVCGRGFPCACVFLLPTQQAHGEGFKGLFSAPRPITPSSTQKNTLCRVSTVVPPS